MISVDLARGTCCNLQQVAAGYPRARLSALAGGGAFGAIKGVFYPFDSGRRLWSAPAL